MKRNDLVWATTLTVAGTALASRGDRCGRRDVRCGTGRYARG